MTKYACPTCRSTNVEALYPEFFGTCITSDMEVLPETGLANHICNSCGLIFNAQGTRGKTEEFYRASYSLMTRTKNAGIKSFAGGGAPKSQAERSCDILRENADLAAIGKILEIGAGKGEFLTYFDRDLPGWEISAFEPSESFHQLKETFPNAHTENCGYQEFQAEDGTYDLIVSLGVLEHVEDPLDMLIYANEKLKPGGDLFIRVPNFAKNPNDMFCADHLSKLTEASLRALMGAAGMEVEAVVELGVPIFVKAKKIGSPSRSLPNVAEDNRKIALQNVNIAKSLVESVISARTDAKADGSNFAIFGLGSSGLFAPFLGEFDTQEITAYVDENTSVHGSTIHNRPVGGLDFIKEYNIGHIALAISPVYFEQVSAKLEPLGVKVHKAET